jgi:hypothetical protein
MAPVPLCFFLFPLLLPASKQLAATHLPKSIEEPVFCVLYFQRHGHPFGLSDAQFGCGPLETALHCQKIEMCVKVSRHGGRTQQNSSLQRLPAGLAAMDLGRMLAFFFVWPHLCFIAGSGTAYAIDIVLDIRSNA